MPLLLLLVLLLAGCAHAVPPRFDAPPRSLAVASDGPERSAIYLERVDEGIVVIDLGWWGADGALEDGLRRMGATPDDVVAVLLTHTHRDHIGAWRSVAHAPFYLASPGVDLLFGREEHLGWIPRWAAAIHEVDRPSPDDIEVRPFASDTVLTVGGDTVRAFLVPGHTAGSAAYLVHGSLFAGDAIARTWPSGLGTALRGYSDDVEQAWRSVASLRDRVAPYRVEWICTAHLDCAEATEELWTELLER
ncbi:MAG: MBL fold metallo-hydrolase [Gemmatimonadota bacterium]|jgi:glyoxylase-like metal-dependent hydrolase (beta-lactamase superfamily II)